MGVSNLKRFNEYATKYGIKDYQLIMGADKSGRNVKGMLIGGYTFDRLSLFGLDGDDQIEGLMHNIACMGVAKAYELHTSNKKSVAKQKVNTAHGRTNNELIENYLNQCMTYADRFENIQFKGQTWVAVFNQLIEREQDIEVSELRHWVNTMKDFHARDAKKVILNLIQSKQIRVLNNHVYAEKTFKIFLDKFCEENGLEKISEENQNKMIDSYCDKFVELIGA